MEWIKRQIFYEEFYYETTDYNYQIWKVDNLWIVEQAQPYYQCDMYIDDVYRVIGKFDSLAKAKHYVEWYSKKGVFYHE